MKLKQAITISAIAPIFLLTAGCWPLFGGGGGGSGGISSSYGSGDYTPPVISLSTSVSSVSYNNSPDIVIDSDEGGAIEYDASCPGATSYASGGGMYSSTAITLGPLSWNKQYTTCSVVVIDASGNRSNKITLPSFRIIKQQVSNDTGISLCGDYAGSGGTDNNDLDCSAVGSTQNAAGTDTDGDPVPAGQDAVYGRDADVAYNGDADGDKGFSFVKIDNNGNFLSYSASSWACVQDNITGLVWEIKTAANTGLYQANDTYTWYQSSDNNGNAGTQNSNAACSGYNATASNTFCNTQAFIDRVNGQDLCGYNDWRLPSAAELLSIVNKGQTVAPAIDHAFFPSAQSDGYWTAESFMGDATKAWLVQFNDGSSVGKLKSESHAVRLVRGGL